MAKLVSNVYGDALFELAMESERMDDFLEESNCIIEVLSQNPEFGQMMNHPKIVKEEKISLIETIFKGKISDELIGLMNMVVEKGHFKDMEAILSYFVSRVKEYRNIGIAYVSTPLELTEEQKKAVEEKLLATTHYVSFEMNYSIDESLIGGMVIRIGDRVVDSSIKTKLYELTKELSKVQLKVGETAS